MDVLKAKSLAPLREFEIAPRQASRPVDGERMIYPMGVFPAVLGQRFAMFEVLIIIVYVS
jgi:hypothetical protein